MDSFVFINKSPSPALVCASNILKEFPRKEILNEEFDRNNSQESEEAETNIFYILQQK